jgi:tetratricopeptide (TPR) repeat protein
MADKRLYIGSAFRHAWLLFRSNAVFLLAVSVTVSLLPMILQVSGPLAAAIWAFLMTFGPDGPFKTIGLAIGVLTIVLFRISGWLLQQFLQLGFVKVSLQLARGERPGFRSIFSCAKLLFRVLIAEFLCSLAAALIALMVLVLPNFVLNGNYFWGFFLLGIIFSAPLMVLLIRMSFSQWIIVDKSAGPIEALRESAKLTRGNLRPVTVLYLLQNLLLIPTVVLLVAPKGSAGPAAFFAVAYTMALQPIIWLSESSAYKQLTDPQYAEEVAAAAALRAQNRTRMSGLKKLAWAAAVLVSVTVVGVAMFVNEFIGLDGLCIAFCAQTNQNQPAINFLTHAIETNDRHFKGRNRSTLFVARGDNYAALGQYKKALADYSEGINIVPDFAFYSRRATVYRKLGMEDLAKQDDLNAAKLGEK